MDIIIIVALVIMIVITFNKSMNLFKDKEINNNNTHNRRVSDND